ncbi:MAG: GspH/FimT family pseudopilin [Thiohalocapsa sp.]|jgi:type IV fimbrial biogenesis protein FimT|uniref:GspH/FimT family pseudopilin n=1 Tax=Thiohalocapsa sp. TaxID=2497641 RepID=UPI0025D21592|nr:GspH/FimT family pseudopilin [Thiohalocapsa sp.]MCG6940548.1 GspH/FimT family pseudopilin [Thiohalocapsa sp.]
MLSSARERRLGSRAAQHTPTRVCAGVTLVELMITIGILVILTTMGIPSFSALIHNNRVAIVANDLTLALTLGRAEGIRRGARMRVCASADGVDCDITSAHDCNADWSGGWIVLPEDGGAVVRARESVGGHIGPVEQSGAPWVTFDALGAATLPDCVSAAGAAFAIGDPAAPRLRDRVVELLPSGRVALRTP